MKYVIKVSALMALCANISWASEESKLPQQFNLQCVTTVDDVSGSLANGSPVQAAVIGEKRNYRFDLEAKNYSNGKSIKPLSSISPNEIVLAEKDDLQVFGGGAVVMRSDWKLDVKTLQMVKDNTFYADSLGIEKSGWSHWEQSCELKPK